jgi:photosystem II stability/assembly factor-like uncharacterized protein
MSYNLTNKGLAAVPFLLLVVLAHCRASIPSCRCGVEATEHPKYVGPAADGGFPYPKVVGFSSEGGQRVIKLQVSIERDGHTVETGLRTSDNGTTWVVDSDYQPGQWRVSSDPNTVYRSDNNVYFGSTDGGQQWDELKLVIDGRTREEFSREFSKIHHAQLRLSLAAIHPGNPKTLFGTLQVWVYSDPGSAVSEIIDVPGMYVSHDRGNHWTLFTHSIGNVRKRAEIPSILAICPSNPQVMISRSHDGIVRSKDGGKSWNPVGQQSELERPAEQLGRAEAIAELRRKGETSPIPEVTPAARLQVYQMEFQPSDARVIYLVTNKGLYRSEDGGDSWCLFFLGVPKLESITSLTFDPENPKQIYVGTEMTVMVSSDGGCNFHRVFDYEEFAKAQFVGR